MNDYTKLFNAFVIPYFTCAAFSGVVFMLSTGQEVDMLLWTAVGAGLSKMGISFGIGKIRKK